MSPGPRPTSIPSGILIHPSVWPQWTWAENWGAVSHLGGGAGPQLTQCGQGKTTARHSNYSGFHTIVWQLLLRYERGDIRITSKPVISTRNVSTINCISSLVSEGADSCLWNYCRTGLQISHYTYHNYSTSLWGYYQQGKVSLSSQNVKLCYRLSSTGSSLWQWGSTFVCNMSAETQCIMQIHLSATAETCLLQLWL